jgi:hypothetical protein
VKRAILALALISALGIAFAPAASAKRFNPDRYKSLTLEEARKICDPDPTCVKYDARYCRVVAEKRRRYRVRCMALTSHRDAEGLTTCQTPVIWLKKRGMPPELKKIRDPICS